MIRVVPIDPADEATFALWHKAFLAATHYERVDPPAVTLEELRLMLQPSSMERLTAWFAYLDDEPAGVGGLQMPTLDNQDMAYFVVAVLPSLRRRGVGTVLYDHTVAEARAEGRTSLVFQLETAAEKLASAPGAAFATARGFSARNTMVRQQLPLPLAPERLDSFGAKAAERTGDYRTLGWVGACPDEYAEQYATLKGLLSVDAPQGGLELEQEKWDVARLREMEERSRASGRETFTTVAVAPDGMLAGHTQISVERDDDRRAVQQDTLVLKTHRGHRLGLALKVANLRLAQAERPDLNRIDTWNAEQNGPMVAVNVDLGFQPIEIAQMWQGSI